MMNVDHFVLTLSSPGATSFQIGSLTIRWYGIFIAIAFLTGYFLAESLTRKNNLDLNHFGNLIFFALLFSVVFARLYFVTLNIDYFKDHLTEIPKIWYGGQSIHGGILGGVLTAVIYTRLKKISFYRYIDILAVVFQLGQAIGRWGNFFNNEAFGKPVKNFFIQLSIPQEFRPDKYIGYEYFHPAFLYESILDFLLFVFLYKKYKVFKEKPGKTFWMYLFSYSIIRFFLESIRVDSLCLFYNLPSAQVVSLIVILISLYMLCRGRSCACPYNKN